MKIKEENKQVFEPITLTIESKEDLILILALIGGVSSDIQREVTGKDSGTIYHELKQLALDRGITKYKFLHIKVSDYFSTLE